MQDYFILFLIIGIYGPLRIYEFMFYKEPVEFDSWEGRVLFQ